MSLIELKSSLGYIWYRIICFLIEVLCHINNLGIIRYFDSSVQEKWKEPTLIFCLIIVAFTIVASSISTVLNFLKGFGNSLEDYPFYFNKSRKTISSLSFLSLFDIHIAILILLPKLIINTQLIRANIKEEGYVFESSLDFVIGSVNKRVEKDGLSMFIIDATPYASSEIINLLLVLIRYNFSYANIFYRINLYMSIIMSIHSFLTILLTMLIYGTFEVLFKQLSIMNSSINIYSYLLISSLMLSVLLILLTNHALYHFGTLIYSQEEIRISNQLIRLSNMDDHYLHERPIRRSLVFYFLFVILSITSQLPFLILIWKYFLSGLVDHLFVVYLIFLLLFLFMSISFFSFLCFCRLSCWKLKNFDQYHSQFEEDPSSTSSQMFHRSPPDNVEEKLFHIESPRLIPTRSISSCGLTVIDHEHTIGAHSHPTFQQTPGMATDALLVMH